MAKNTPSFIQAMDHGILLAIKRIHRRIILDEVISVLLDEDNAEDTRAQHTTLT